MPFGLLPLRMVESHFSALAGIWLTERADVFSTQVSESALARDRRAKRAAAHLAALRRNRDDAVHHGGLELQSPSFGAVYTAARVLAHVAPEACLDRDGRVVVRASREDAVVAALSDARLPASFDLTNPAACAIASASRPISEGALWATLLRPDPTFGMVLAARAEILPGWARALLFRWALRPFDATSRAERHRAGALLALGRHFARRSVNEQRGFAALVDSTLGALLCQNLARSPQGILAMSVVGHAPTAARIAREVEREPCLDAVFALGILGFPRDAPLLARLMRIDRGASEPEQSIAVEAMRALYLMTGRLFTVSPSRADGRRMAPDHVSAAEYAAAWSEQAAALTRHHLGVSLEAEHSDPAQPAPSHRWIRAVLTGATSDLTQQLAPSSVVDNRPRRLSRFFSVEPPRYLERDSNRYPAIAAPSTVRGRSWRPPLQ